MSWFSFISLRSHDAIVAGKDEQIETLRLHSGYLKDLVEKGNVEREALNERILALVDKSVTMKLTPIPTRRERAAEEQIKEPETLDLSMVDPNDNEALITIVKREMPGGARVNASSVMRSVERLRAQVVEAHEARRRDLGRPGLVPAGIAALIDETEQAGRDAAKGA